MFWVHVCIVCVCVIYVFLNDWLLINIDCTHMCYDWAIYRHSKNDNNYIQHLVYAFGMNLDLGIKRRSLLKIIHLEINLICVCTYNWNRCDSFFSLPPVHVAWLHHFDRQQLMLTILLSQMLISLCSSYWYATCDARYAMRTDHAPKTRKIDIVLALVEL